MIRSLSTGLLAAGLAVAAPFGAHALDDIRTTNIVAKIDDAKMVKHLDALQAIAARRGGTRASGTPGYDDSVAYVRNTLTAAGYRVVVQPFEVSLFTENAPPVFARLSPSPATFRPNVDVATLEYSAAGDVSGGLALAGGIQIPPPATPGVTSGCAPADFPAATAGRVALVQRGTCPFLDKVRNAQAAGAIGVVIFNEGQPGREDVVAGTLGESVAIPAVGVSYAVGRELHQQALAGAVRVRIKVDSTTRDIVTSNVIADLAGRVANRTVVVGAHLDSVAEGPGINDNGTGTAALLTIAKELAALGKPQNAVRFAFWGAEESGLLGSTYYVGQLSDAERAEIALNLNFDMLGSTNYVRFVYDGDGTLGQAGPAGSDIIERVFQQHFGNQFSSPTEFDGRSDYLPFIEAGIPAGGLFSGAEGVKTAQEARMYGGTAGRAYDACYHQACDGIANVSRKALRELGRAAGHAVYTFAMTKQDVRTSGAAVASAQSGRSNAAALNAEYRGPRLAR